MRSSRSVQIKRERFFYGYVVVLAGFGIYATIFGILTAFGVFFKPLLTEFGWTRAMTAGAYTLYSILSGILGIAMGRLTDRFGPRVVVMTLGSFLGLGVLLMSEVSAIWQVYLFWGVAVAIGRSTAIVPLTATVARWFTKRRALMTGIVTAGGAGVGGAVLPAIAGWLILAYGWRTSYIVTGIIGVIFVLFWGHFLKRDPAQIGQLPDGVAEVQVSEVVQQDSGPPSEGFLLQEVIRTRQFWMMGIIFFGYGFYRGTILVHIVAHVTDLGFSLMSGSYILALIAAVSAVSGIGIGFLADKIGNRPTLMIMCTVTAMVLFGATMARGLWMLYLFAVIFGLGRGGAEVVRFPLATELFGLGSIGVILGGMEFMTAFGTAIGPLLAGIIFDVTGNYDLAFLACGIVATVALTITWLLTHPSNRIDKDSLNRDR